MKIERKFELHSTHLAGQHLALCWSLNIMPQTTCLKFRISSIVFSPFLLSYSLHHSAHWYTFTFSVPLCWKNFFFITCFSHDTLSRLKFALCFTSPQSPLNLVESSIYEKKEIQKVKGLLKFSRSDASLCCFRRVSSEWLTGILVELQMINFWCMMSFLYFIFLSWFNRTEQKRRN